MRFSQGVIFLALAALTLFVSFPTSSAFGQSISITYPTATTSVKEGSDYFTDKGRPLNGTDSNQLSWRENYDETTVRSTGGVWTGTNSSVGGYVLPLFGGFFGAMTPKGLQSDSSFPLMGADSPIDSSKYHLLSYRLNHSSRSTNAVYWNNDKTQSLWPNPANKCVNYDGIYNGANSHTITGYRIYNYDLANLGSCEVGGGSWSGSVYSLRLDPSVFGETGSVTQLDWLRVVDPDSAPKLPIYWDSSSIPNGSIVALYIDGNNSGYDGTPFKFFTNNSDPGYYEFPTAALPPGTHYFYLQVLEKVTLNVLATSGYSGKLLINQTPSLKITSPSEITGREYAKDEVGNPWDMSSSADIANYTVSNKWPAAWHQFANEKISGGAFVATASPPVSGAPHGDAAVVLNVPANKPIDTTLYRYLTYRIAVDPASYPTTSKFVEHGAVFRPIAWNTDVVADGVNHKAHQILTGPGNTAKYYTYTVDLYQNPEYGTKWQATQYRNYLRLDPFENTGTNGVPGAPVPNPWFYIDDVKLTTDNYPNNSGIYAMQFSIVDPDSSLLSYSIYRDTDNVGFNGKLIISKSNVAPGNFTVNWNTTGLPAGKKHWLYWVITDSAGNVTRNYAQVPVVTGALPAKVVASKKMDDIDGDGVSDPVVYRSAIAFYRNGSTIGQNSIGFGDIYSTAVNADIDGDRATDNGIYVQNNGALKWYFVRSSDGAIYPRSWGVVGDKPVLGDYDNDGVDDVAIYRPSTGEWFVNFASGGSKMQQWGKSGDIPVPADYDGDGKTDFAIWRPSDGTWWILNSGFATKKTSASYSKYQWGLNGDRPVPADWFGTGKAYPAVWRPSNGTWYLRNIGGSAGSYTSYQFGLPEDISLVGYYNKSKPNEVTPTVYRASTGTWFSYTRSNGAVGIQQWGIPGDQVPAYRYK